MTAPTNPNDRLTADLEVHRLAALSLRAFLHRTLMALARDRGIEAGSYAAASRRYRAC